MLDSARQKLNSKIKVAYNWEDFMTHLNNKNLVYTPW